MKQKTLWDYFKTYLVHEIDIDFKACVYFFCVVFFYCVVQLCYGRTSVRILTLAEILIANYVICYVQTYVFHDFDESDRLGKEEALGAGVCTLLYTGVSLLLGWFDRNPLLTVFFAVFVVLCYLCVILCYIVKRKLDTRQLNQMLTAYKQQEDSSQKGSY